MPVQGQPMAWATFAAEVKRIVISSFGRLDSVVDLTQVQDILQKNNINAPMSEVSKAFVEAMQDPKFQAHFTPVFVPGPLDPYEPGNSGSNFKLKWGG